MIDHATTGDSDLDGDTLSVSAIRTGTEAGTGTGGTVGGTTTGTYGTLTLASDGSYTYIADQAAADALALGDTDTDTFTYTVSDGNGGTDTAELVITVTGTNDAPTISDVADIGFSEAADASAQDLSASGTVSFGDLDGTDVVDISTTLSTAAVWSGGSIDPALKALLEAGFSASVTDAAAPGSTAWGYTVNNADLDFLKVGETITLTYTLTATDNVGATATDTVTITITGTNDGPSAVDDTGAVNEDATLTVRPPMA